MKKSVLAVSFGTTHTDTLEKSIMAVERDIFKAFPDYEPRRAFTSRMIINSLRKRGISIDSENEAFFALKNHDEIIVVPTHIINGFEYEKILNAAKQCEGNVKISRPLISLSADYDAFINAMAPVFSEKDTQYIFMGHGSEHFADSMYAAMDYRFKAAGFNNVHIGTVEGYPPFELVAEKIKGAKKAVLMPMMLVAGDHAKNDMLLGWKPALEKLGIETECIMKGLGEYPDIRKIYVEHAKEVAQS